MPQAFYRAPFQPDHIIADTHGGRTIASNLCWACFHCNLPPAGAVNHPKDFVMKINERFNVNKIEEDYRRLMVVTEGV